tara:strand:- start:29 stop:697 length:669 start_codon:yes stop_codon:yes gene_type:complete
MKNLLKSPWPYAVLSVVVSMVVLFLLMNAQLKKMEVAEHHDPIAPTGPVKYPGKLTDELKDFVKDLETRAKKITIREEAVQAMLSSINQERQEFDLLKKEVEKLQSDFDKKVEDFQQRRLFLADTEQKKMVDLAKTIESLSPSAAVTLFLQLNKENTENLANSTITGILSLMKPSDIAPIFEEMTDGKQANDESKALAATLTEQLRFLVKEQKTTDDGASGG